MACKVFKVSNYEEYKKAIDEPRFALRHVKAERKGFPHFWGIQALLGPYKFTLYYRFSFFGFRRYGKNCFQAVQSC